MFFKPNPSAPAPIYLQLMEQIKHAVEVGALKPGDQLPGIRNLAESLVINPNTVAKAYRELEHEAIIELRHGAGAFVRRRVAAKVQNAAPLVTALVERLKSRGLSDEEIRRLFEMAMMQHVELARTK
jgi:DNA-binding transcriptional regulator YhcF (GntR family)